MYPAAAVVIPLVDHPKARTFLLGLAVVRAALGAVALLLVPVLYEDHFLIVVLLRPTKEILLAGGFAVRRGDLSLPALVGCAVPLMLLGVWQFYALGKAYRDEIEGGDGLPRWARRVLPTKRIKDLEEILDRKGERVIVGGRLAAFPSSLLGAAAGASGMSTRSFLGADGLGAALSLIEVIGAGYALGAAYKQAGPWITVAGVVVLVGLVVYLGRSLRRT